MHDRLLNGRAVPVNVLNVKDSNGQPLLQNSQFSLLQRNQIGSLQLDECDRLKNTLKGKYKTWNYCLPL